jgi:hypothetical protein
MHLSMNTQKAVLRLVLHCAADSDCGAALKNCLTPSIELVQDLRLPCIPCHMFSTNKFGGFVAENYQALTMLSPWLFWCLLGPEFEPKVTVLPPGTKPYYKWAVNENIGWLKVRGIKVPAKVPACVLRSIVVTYYTGPLGLPVVLQNTHLTVKDIWHLLLLQFRVFGTLFSTELKREQAGN